MGMRLHRDWSECTDNECTEPHLKDTDLLNAECVYAEEDDERAEECG